MRGKKIWTKFRQKMRRRIGVEKSSFKLCSITLSRKPKPTHKINPITYCFVTVYWSKFPCEKIFLENSRETHDEISYKKFRQFGKKIIFTWHKEPCFTLRAQMVSVVQAWRFSYLTHCGNPDGWHASVGLAYLPLGEPRQKRILK